MMATDDTLTTFLRPVAFYIAGRAVIARELGQQVTRVSLSRETRQGSTVLAWADSNPDDAAKRAQNDLMVALAGRIAQREEVFSMFPEERAEMIWPRYDAAHASHKLDVITHLETLDTVAVAQDASTPTQRMTLATERCTDLVEHHKGKIHMLAAALLARETLDMVQILAILGA